MSQLLPLLASQLDEKFDGPGQHRPDVLQDAVAVGLLRQLEQERNQHRLFEPMARQFL